MKLPRLKTILLTPLILFAVFYVAVAIYVLLDDRSVAPLDASPTQPITIAIFGASGTAGDGILKAALASPDIGKIHVITRRTTPRMEAGVAAGKLQLTTHTDYLDYSAIEDTFIGVDAVYWAIGISTFKVDEETYGKIHVDFPLRFVAAWSRVSQKELMYGFFAPVRAAVRAKQIGQAMIEVTVRGDEFDNGRKLGTGTIIRYSDTYLERNKELQ